MDVFEQRRWAKMLRDSQNADEAMAQRRQCLQESYGAGFDGGLVPRILGISDALREEMGEAWQQGRRDAGRGDILKGF